MEIDIAVGARVEIAFHLGLAGAVPRFHRHVVIAAQSVAGIVAREWVSPCRDRVCNGIGAPQSVNIFVEEAVDRIRPIPWRSGLPGTPGGIRRRILPRPTERKSPPHLRAIAQHGAVPVRHGTSVPAASYPGLAGVA